MKKTIAKAGLLAAVFISNVVLATVQIDTTNATCKDSDESYFNLKITAPPSYGPSDRSYKAEVSGSVFEATSFPLNMVSDRFDNDGRALDPACVHYVEVSEEQGKVFLTFNTPQKGDCGNYAGSPMELASENGKDFTLRYHKPDGLGKDTFSNELSTEVTCTGIKLEK